MANDYHIRAEAFGCGFDFIGDNTRNQFEGTENGISSILNRIEQFLEVSLTTAYALDRYQRD